MSHLVSAARLQTVNALPVLLRRRALHASARLARAADSGSTEEIAQSFLSKFGQESSAVVRKQTLDGNQLRLLSLTLGRPAVFEDLSVANDEVPPAGTPLPPGYHLAYFTPAQLGADLGGDGTDKSFNPAAPFTRRMWAGGRLQWARGNALEVGQAVTETTRVLSAEAKRTKAGEEMIVVGVEKTFANERGTALTDQRQWLFRKELTSSPTPAEAKEALKSLPEAPSMRDFKQDAVTLFRFSALTFNAHKIHYSRPWCREVEGHRELVVHGPLNLVNVLDLWRDARGGKAWPKSIKYRATSPLYADEPYRLLIEDEDASTRQSEARIVDAAGTVAMKATIESFA